MKNKKEFLKLDYNLITLGANNAIILSYIKSWQDNDKVCFEKQEDISTKLNISYPTVKRIIKKYTECGVIIKDKNGHHYKNRKSLTIDEVKLDELINRGDIQSKAPNKEVKEKVISDTQTKEKLSEIESEVPTIESKGVVQDEIIEEVVKKPKFIKKTTTELINYVMDNSDGIDAQTIGDFKTAIICGDIRDFWQIDGVLNEIIK